MKFYLDISKWRCGRSATKKENKLGKGDTCLRNKQGYMCCVGQWSEQIDPHAKTLNVGMPDTTVFDKRNLLVNKTYDDSSKLSYDCADINDDTKTTVKEKIALLRKRLKRNGHQLVVKNLSKLAKP